MKDEHLEKLVSKGLAFRLNAKGSRLRCPKCKGPIKSLKEKMNGWEYYEVIKGVAIPIGNDGSHEAPVFAECSECEHEWRLRGLVQITDIFEDA